VWTFPGAGITGLPIFSSLGWQVSRRMAAKYVGTGATYFSSYYYCYYNDQCHSASAMHIVPDCLHAVVLVQFVFWLINLCQFHWCASNSGIGFLFKLSSSVEVMWRYRCLNAAGDWSVLKSTMTFCSSSISRLVVVVVVNGSYRAWRLSPAELCFAVKLVRCV